MMMALLPAKRDGSLFYLALHHWKQPIENMFAVQALKLWSPEPAPRLRLSGSGDSLRVVALKQCYAEVMPPDTLVVSCAIADEKPTYQDLCDPTASDSSDLPIMLKGLWRDSNRNTGCVASALRILTKKGENGWG